jgi:hypothetical protein
LSEVVKEYIKAKVLLTECQQNHFKQLCQTCQRYTNCNIYNRYIVAWMDLQETSKNEKDSYGMEKIKLCRTCKYWGDEYKQNLPVDQKRSCVLILNNYAWDKIEFGVDDEYGLHLETAASFGCVCWELKC